MERNPSGTQRRGVEKPMLLPEGIRITKGGVFNMLTFNKLAPEEMPLIGGEDTIYWLLE